MNAKQLEDLLYAEPSQSSSTSESYRLLANHYQVVARQAIQELYIAERKIEQLSAQHIFGVTFTWATGETLFVPAGHTYRGIRKGPYRPITSNYLEQQDLINEWLEGTVNALQRTKELNVI